MVQQAHNASNAGDPNMLAVVASLMRDARAGARDDASFLEEKKSWEVRSSRKYSDHLLY